MNKLGFQNVKEDLKEQIKSYFETNSTPDIFEDMEFIVEKVFNEWTEDVWEKPHNK